MTDTLPSQTATPLPTSRRVVTDIPGPKSRAIHDRRDKVVSAGVSELFPMYIDHAHDALVVDVDGNQFIDFTGGIGVTTVGHTNDAVVNGARLSCSRGRR